MCSNQEQQGTIPKQLNQLTGEIECVKCHRDVPIVTKRVNDAFCRDCFLVYAVHKFRSALGKSKVISPKEHVLVGYSGGPSSSALLHFLQEGIKEGKIHFDVSVIHIDELCLKTVPAEEKQHILQNIVGVVKERGFPLYISSLECVMSASTDAEGGGKGSGGDELSQAAGQWEAGATLGHPGQADRLTKLLESITPISAREEFLRVLRQQVLVGVARQRGFSKVVTGETATSLAVRIMTDMAKGKGSQVAFDTTIGDDRYRDVTVVRPIRDLNRREIDVYNRLKQVEAVSVQHVSDNWHKGNSIERLTADFILGLQESFPSTVPNIVRTSNKLGHEEIEGESIQCAMCESHLDTDVGDCSALRAIEESERLSQPRGEGGVTPQPNAAADRLNASVCYGCRLALKGLNDVSLMPSSILSRSQRQPLSREEMRAQISDFILDDAQSNDDSLNS